jgi:hypothetical protein
MTSTLQTLMSNIVDYAGLFPPAQLPLADALVNYDEYRQGAFSWMLGRFVIPAAKLEEMGRHAGRFTVLGRGGDDASGFLDALKRDLERARAFNDRRDGFGTADVFEARLPESVQADGAAIGELLKQSQWLASKWNSAPLTIFYETSFKGNWRRNAQVTADAVAAHNRRQIGGSSAGIKLRTGGTVATAFPTAEQLAGAIIACRDAGVAFKCTAGLHHPFRRFDKSVNTKMHGFVNVFGGAALAFARKLDEKTLTEILLDEEGSHFLFGEDSFAWKTLMISRAELEQARRLFAISFGSCSFTEPIEDLQSWKLL